MGIATDQSDAEKSAGKSGTVAWSCFTGEDIEPGAEIILKQNSHWFMVAFRRKDGDKLDAIALQGAAKDAVLDVSLVGLARTDYEKIP